jgi:hypothetical protein
MNFDAVLKSRVKCGEGRLLKQLGHELETGKLFVQDHVLAAKCYEYAASFGEFGEFCGKGKAVPFAIHTILNSGLSGLSEDAAWWIINLGYAVENAILFEQDYVMAAKCYEYAASFGEPMAINNLGWLYENGFGVAKDIQKAIMLYEQAADLGTAVAMINLGNLYLNGKLNGEPDYDRVFHYYQLAAKTGDRNGQLCYGNCYHYGWGVEQDYETAYRIFLSLTRSNYPAAYFYIGLYYQHGYFVEQDYATALEYYEDGIELGDDYCYTQMGVMYAEGLGVEKDPQMALECYKAAADQGDSLAYANIGWLYESGAVGEPDLDTAVYYYQIAARAGEAHGKEALKRLGIPESDNPMDLT